MPLNYDYNFLLAPSLLTIYFVIKMKGMFNACILWYYMYRPSWSRGYIFGYMQNFCQIINYKFKVKIPHTCHM